MIDLENKTSFPIEIPLLEKIAQDMTKKDIELIITDNADIQELNRQFRDKNTPTDVLSFPYSDTTLLGSIVISYDYVVQGSKEFGHSSDDELTLLFIHGLLHILGYDHEEDNGEMRSQEMQIIKRHNLPDSLIVRIEG